MSHQRTSNVFTATTCDLHAKSEMTELYVAANASKGYAGKKRFSVNLANLMYEKLPFYII